MKVDNLLALYLYQSKKLSLPGIGTFTLDGSATLPDDAAKVKTTLEGVQFSVKSPAVYEDTLVDFIKEKTGKMKALAIADLDSYTLLAQQFLNIGKPFLIEGVGTLQKTQEGAYQFHAGTPVNVKLEDATAAKQAEQRKKSVFDEEKEQGSIGNRKSVMVVGLLLTLALVAWGAYYLYNKNEPGSNTNANSVIVTDSLPDSTTALTTITPDTSNTSGLPDSLLITNTSTSPVTAATTATSAAGGYKFILWTSTAKARVYEQYEKLKPQVQIGTRDSVKYFLYIPMNIAAADTTRVRDSLKNWFWGKKPMTVSISQN